VYEEEHLFILFLVFYMVFLISFFITLKFNSLGLTKGVFYCCFNAAINVLWEVCILQTHFSFPLFPLQGLFIDILILQ